MIRLQVIEDPNMHDQIVFCAFHSFFSGSPNECWLHTYDDLEIRITGDKRSQRKCLVKEDYCSNIGLALLCLETGSLKETKANLDSNSHLCSLSTILKAVTSWAGSLRTVLSTRPNTTQHCFPKESCQL